MIISSIRRSAFSELKRLHKIRLFSPTELEYLTEGSEIFVRENYFVEVAGKVIEVVGPMLLVQYQSKIKPTLVTKWIFIYDESLSPLLLDART